ncbi:MAG: hypothetical protein V4489_08435 [Chlamydiota bacterium]
MSEETIIDPGLSQLREQTKNVMVPILIKAFQLKSEAGQLTEPPSRLYSVKSKGSLKEVISQLTSLEEDLKLQQLWIESSRHQIGKILTEFQEESLPEKNTQNPSIKTTFSLKPWWKKILGIS